jgi:hypothetical protein
MSAVFVPNENNAPLIVHSYAVPAFQIPVKRFQLIARRRIQICKPAGVLDHIQLPPHDLGDIRPACSL